MTSEPEAIPVANARPVLGRALGAFALDLVLAVAIMLSTLLACGVAWAAWRMAHIVVSGQVDVHDTQALERALGNPGVMAALWMTFISTAATAFLLYFWRRRATARERAASLAAIRRPQTWLYVALTVVVVLVLTTGITTLGQRLGLDVEPSNLVPIEQALALNPVFIFVFAVVLAPIYEEILCRRVLFGRLWAAGWPKLGMLLSGSVFASMHEMPGMSGHSLATTAFTWIPYALMGIAFAWVYKRTGTLWASIATHAVNNAVAMLALNASLGGG